jgi:hypothetical protein
LFFVDAAAIRPILTEHPIKNLADVATSEVLVLDTQTTRAEMAEHVLAVAPQRFSIAGHSLGGWVAQEIAARAGCRSCSGAIPGHASWTAPTSTCAATGPTPSAVALRAEM